MFAFREVHVSVGVVDGHLGVVDLGRYRIYVSGGVVTQTLDIIDVAAVPRSPLVGLHHGVCHVALRSHLTIVVLSLILKSSGLQYLTEGGLEGDLSRLSVATEALTLVTGAMSHRVVVLLFRTV